MLERGSDVAGLAPLCRTEEEGRPCVRSLGGVDVTDHRGPVCARGDEAAVADALVEWFGGTAPGGTLDLPSLQPATGLAPVLAARARAAGMAAETLRDEPFAVLDLPGAWDDYVGALSRKHRHELRRKLRRFAAEHGPAALRTATTATLEADLATFVGLHRSSAGAKGTFMDARAARFFAAVAAAFDSRGWLRLDLLEADGRVLAASFAFEARGVLWLYNMAYDRSAAGASPGFVLCAELIRSAIERGLRTFDLLRGDERYKFELGARRDELERVRVRGPAR